MNWSDKSSFATGPDQSTIGFNFGDQYGCSFSTENQPVFGNDNIEHNITAAKNDDKKQLQFINRGRVVEISEDRLIVVEDWNDMNPILEEKTIETDWNFIQESKNTFNSLQKSYYDYKKFKSVNSRELHEHLLQWKKKIFDASKHYRSLLKIRTNNLIKKVEDPDKVQSSVTQSLAFHLIEILQVNFVQQYAENLGPQLVLWIRKYMQYKEDKGGDEEKYKCIFLGEKDEICSLIETDAGKDYSSNILTKAKDLVKKMPQLGERENPINYLRRFETWNASIKAFIAELKVHISSNQELIGIMNFLSGDLKDLSTTHWLYNLSAYILYCDPAIQVHDLPGIMEKMIPAKGIDQIFYHFLCLDSFTEVLSVTRYYFGDWWNTHTCDLVWHCWHVRGFINREIEEDEMHKLTNFREGFLIQYGNALMTYPSLLYTAYSYMLHLDRKELAALCLELISLDSEKMCLKVINEAQKNNLHHVERSAHIVMGMKYIKIKKSYAAGIRHLVIANDHQRIERIVYTELKEYAERVNLYEVLQNGSFGDLQTLESIGVFKSLQSMQLLFIGNFLHYAHCRDADTLIKLLYWSDLTKSFRFVLLAHAVYDMATSENKAFNYNSIIYMMKCLEDLCFSHRTLPLMKKYEDCIPVIRSVLSRKLAKSILSP